MYTYSVYSIFAKVVYIRRCNTSLMQVNFFNWLEVIPRKFYPRFRCFFYTMNIFFQFQVISCCLIYIFIYLYYNSTWKLLFVVLIETRFFLMIILCYNEKEKLIYQVLNTPHWLEKNLVKNFVRFCLIWITNKKHTWQKIFNLKFFNLLLFS